MRERKNTITRTIQEEDNNRKEARMEKRKKSKSKEKEERNLQLPDLENGGRKQDKNE